MSYSNIYNFQEILASEKLHIPLEANFIVIIEDIISILDKLKFAEQEISPDKGKIEVNSDNSIWQLNSNKFDNFYFATSVSLPGESVGTGRVGFSAEGGSGVYGGLLSGPVLRGRKDNTNLEMGIIETNESFLDYVIRPWIVATSQYGLFARSSNNLQNFKTTVSVYFLDKSSTNPDSPKLRKVIKFNNAAPVEVVGFETGYGSGKGVDLRVAKTAWTYSTYSVTRYEQTGPSIPSLDTLPTKRPPNPGFNNIRGRERTPVGT